MADHGPSGPVELGAEMDYAEHEKTYAGFLALTKYGTIFCVALMIALAFFYFATSGGVINFLFSLILMVVITIVGAIALK